MARFTFIQIQFCMNSAFTPETLFFKTGKKQNALLARTLSLLQKISAVLYLLAGTVNILRKQAIFFLLMLSAIAVKSQTSGDYRSVLGGSWSSLTTWQRYNGTTWLTPTNVSPQGYPGQFVGNANVLIQPANAVDINVSPAFSIGSITVGTTGVNATLAFNSSSAITITVTGNVAVTDGTFNVTNATGAKNHTLNIGGNLNIATGNTFNLASGGDDISTVVFNTATAQTISNAGIATFYNLTLSKSAAANTVTSTGNSFSVTNNLTVTTGNLILQAANANYAVTNDVIISTNGTLSHNVNYNSTGFGLTTAGNFSCDGIYNYSSNAMVIMTGATKTLRTGTNAASAFSKLTLNNGGFTANGALKVNDVFSVALGSANTFATGSQTVTASGGLYISGGTVAIAGGTTTITNGLFAGIGTGNGAVTLSGGTLNADNVNIGNVTRTGTLTHSTGTFNITGDLTIANGSSFVCTSSPTVSIAGDWTNNGTFTRSTGTVIFNGAAAQIIGGTTSTTFNNLTNSNADATGLSLAADETVANNLTLNATSNGDITTGSNTLILTKSSSGSAISGATSSRYIIGNLQFVFPSGNTSNLVYPVGSATVYAPVTYTIRSVSGTVGITISSNTGNPTNEDNPITNSSGIDPTKKSGNYWTISKTGTGSFTNYDALFDFTNCTNTGTVASYKLRNFTTAWADIAAPTLTATSIKGNTLTGFGEFTTGEQRTAPSVGANPANQNLCSGAATFTATSSASPVPLVQWQRNTGTGFVNITASLDAPAVYSGFNGNALSISGGTAALNGYLYRAVYSNINGSATTNSATLTVTTTTIAYTAPLCSGNLTANVTRTGVTGGTYTAAAGLVINSSTGQINLTTSTPGTYTVTYSYTGACGASTATTSVTVNTSPVITISANFCIGNGYVQLTSTSSSSYLWSTGSAAQNIAVNTAGNFSVTATDANGCTGSDTYNTAPELVVNGDFEAGNTGFTTLYTYTSAANGLYPEGYYAVGSNANYYHGNFYGVDHTTGSGNCMIINGAPTTRNVWQETITVAPNTLYYFSAYAMSVNNASPFAQLQFAVNNVAVGSVANLVAGPSSNAGPFNWIRFYGTWNSGSATSAIINVVDLQTAAGGNDFALDDISFSTLSPVSFGLTAAGNSPVCAGNAINLTATLTGGIAPFTYAWTGPPSYSSSAQNPTIASAVSANSGTYNLSVTDKYGCAVTGSVAMVVNPLPVNKTISAAASTICSTTSTNIQITASENGVSYQLRNNTGNVAIGTPVAGNGGTINLSTGALTTATTFNVLATNSTTFCSVQMSGTVSVSINPLPTDIAPTAQTASFCAGNSTNIQIANSQAGVKYQLRDNSNNALIGSTVSGNNGTINLPTGTLSATTVFNVLATFNSTSCFVQMTSTVTVTVNPLPTDIAPVAQAASICNNSSTNIQIAGSQSGVSYQLRNNFLNTNVGSAVAGNGGTISLSTGTLITSTTYNVVATNTTTTCALQMSSTVTVTVNPVIGNNNISAAQTICSGNTPAALAGSAPTGGSGTYIYLWESATAGSGGPYATASGTSNTQNYTPGSLTQNTWYRRTVTSGGCSNTTAGIQITVNPLPTDIAPVAQASSICTSTSTNIQIAGSQTGVNYQLRNNAGNANIGTAVTGTGGTISLSTGTLSSTTTFNVLATDNTTSCFRQMTSTVTITVNPVIANNTISSSQTICSGTAPAAFTGSLPTGGSSSYVYLWESSTTSASSGFATAAGTSNGQNYTAGTLTQNTWYRRTVTSGGCSSSTAAIQITINPLPTDIAPVAQATPLCTGTSTNIQIAGSQAGVNYQLRNNATNANVGTAVAGTGASIDLPTGNLSSTTIFNVLATNTSTSCFRQMTSTVTVIVNPVIVNNTIGTAQSVCTGTAPAAFTGATPTGGSGTYVYLWESSTTSAAAGFATAAGTSNGQNYTAGTLTQNTWYRRTVTSGGCSNTTAAIQITINPLPTDIAPAAQAATICSGSSTNIQIAGSQSGVNYQLRNNATNANLGTAVAGTGASIDLPTGALSANTTFNVVATNTSTSCSRQMTSTVTVTVTPAIANNTIGTAQAICSGTTPSALTGALPTGGTGAYTYLWESSTTSAVAGFATAAGTSNGQNYTPGALTQNTWYRRTVTSGTCSSIATAIQITINALPTDIAPVAQAASICTGTSTNIQIAGSQSGVTYQLRNNATNANVGTAVSGTGGLISLPTGTLSASTTFNVVATNTSTTCSIQMTSTITVTVNPVLASNTLSSSSAVCSGGSTTITGSLPTGGSGSYAYSWESSTTSASSGFTAVACACTAQNITPSGLTQNTWFRRTVSSGGCSSTSAAILITVNPAGQWVGGASGDWNVSGNWCGGIPTSSTNVVIPSGSVITIQTTNAVANTVSISAGGSLVMTGAYNLTITAGGTFTNNGTFTASGSTTGSVIFNGNGTISGTTTFQNIDAKGALDFGTASTINGTFTLQTGGSVTGNSPTYVCPNSTLQYNTNSVFARGLEWTTNPNGAGYPSNVIVQNNTTINFPAVGQGYVCNDLTIQSGGSLLQNYSGGSASLSVGRNVAISGTLSLGAMGATTGGDINVGGSWTRNSGATFTSNDRKVTFDGPTNFSGRGTSFATITAPASSLKDNEGGFGGEKFAHIWINKTNTTDSVVLLSNITVTRELGLTKGTFSLRNSDVTMVSNSTRTADIAPVSTPANIAVRYAGTGRFNIQRYVQNPTAVRSWRLLTAPVQSATAPNINTAWQYNTVNPDKTLPNANGGTYNPWPGYGTHITGPGGTYSLANGWDQGTNAASILYAGAGVTTWTNPSSTTGTKVTDQPGWMLFVRGDRGFAIGNQYTPSQNVTIETRGAINTGNVVKAVSAGKQVIGNPYPSAISFKDVDVSGTPGRNSNYYRWDPKMFTSYTQPGKWVSFTGLGNSYIATTSASAYDANGTIESGEAIIIEPTAAGSITFHESDKLALTSSLVGIANRPTNNYALLRSDMYAGNGSNYTLTDAVVNLFEADFTNQVTSEDVKKVVTFNTKESFTLERDALQLAIEKRKPVDVADTIFYGMSKFNMLPYQIRFTPSGFDPSVTAFLEDAYLHTATPVSLQAPGTADFEITADPASSVSNRFRLVMKQATVLPVTFTSVKAWKDKATNAVEWQVQNELSIKQYDLERSGNGIDFTKMATVPAQGNYAGSRTYSKVDIAPVQGENFYRIRSIGNDGNNHLSKVVKVNAGVAADIKLLSNPVTDGMARVNLANAEAGEYSFRLINPAGQTIMVKAIKHTGGDLQVKMDVSQKLAAGKYTIEVIEPDSISTINVLYQ